MTCAYDISIPVSFSSWARILSMSSCTGMVIRFTSRTLALAAQVRMASSRCNLENVHSQPDIYRFCSISFQSDLALAAQVRMAALAHYKPTRTLSFCVCAHNRTRLILAAQAAVIRGKPDQTALA